MVVILNQLSCYNLWASHSVGVPIARGKVGVGCKSRSHQCDKQHEIFIDNRPYNKNATEEWSVALARPLSHSLPLVYTHLPMKKTHLKLTHTVGVLVQKNDLCWPQNKEPPCFFFHTIIMVDWLFLVKWSVDTALWLQMRMVSHSSAAFRPLISMCLL